MCLYQVYEEKPKRTFGFGWKIFSLEGNRLSGSVTQGTYIPKKWYKALYGPDRTSGPGADKNKYSYPMGFHIFRFKKMP